MKSRQKPCSTGRGAENEASSPLRSHLTTTPEVPLPSPPLALGIGHVALLLASGHLDGVVRAEGGPPHAVRGTARKREYVSDVTETIYIVARLRI